MDDRKGLVQVHNEPGAIRFKYDVVGSTLSLALPKKPVSREALQLQPELAAPPSRPVELPSERENGDAAQLDDFLAFDPPKEPVENAVPNGGARSGPDHLLDDFIPLGPAPSAGAAGVEGAAAAAAGAAAGTGGGRPELLKQVPWLGSLKGIRSPLLRLHQEIVELCRYLAPSGEEHEARAAAIARVGEAVQSIWPSAEVKVFGSFATGLYLPTSDVDAVVVNSGCGDVPQGLKALAQALMRRKLAKNIQVIAKAKVPIIKFEEAESGYNFDISFDVANGPEAAENVRALMESLPPMRPLVMVLKVFLQQRELNEVYSGGMGSYALLVMVAAFLQLHPTRHPHAAGGQRFGSSAKQQGAAPLEQNLGELLVDFFRLYGRSLNNEQVGVSCRKGGSYFAKRAKGFHQAERPFLLAVEDPNDPENDLGKNSFQFSRVRTAFDWAYNQLTAPCPPGESMLRRIMRLDPVLFMRQPPPLPGGGDEGGRGEKRHKREKRQREEKQQGSGGGRQKEQRKEHKRKRRERSISIDDDAGRGGDGQRSQQEQQQQQRGGGGGGGGKRHKRSQGARGGDGMKVSLTHSGSRHIRFD